MSKRKDSAKVADAYEKLYSELPENVTGGQAAQLRGSGANEPREALVKLLKDHLPPSEQREIDDELKKTASLQKTRLAKSKIKKPQPKRRTSKKYLTARERRSLGLNRLPREGISYDDMRPLHALWKGYITDLVDFDRKLDEQLQMRLCRADYHGAYFKVTRAGCPSLVGLEGFVAAETRNTFQLVAKDNKLRIVPKAGTAVSFEISGKLVTLDAGIMAMKPADRAVKKWKTRAPLPL